MQAPLQCWSLCWLLSFVLLNKILHYITDTCVNAKVHEFITFVVTTLNVLYVWSMKGGYILVPKSGIISRPLIIMVLFICT